MRVLVTGANGFVGREVVAALREQGDRVTCASRNAQPHSCDGEVRWTAVGSVDADTDWRDALADVDGVIHLVARTHRVRESQSSELRSYRQVNVDGTRRLIEQASAAGVSRVVYVSSIKAVGERTTQEPFRETSPPAPEDVYGRTKLEAENVLRDTLHAGDCDYTIVRPPLVYGPGVRGNLDRLAELVQRGVPLPLSCVSNRRSLVGVGNLADLLAQCVRRPQASRQTFHVADEEEFSTPELIRRIALAMDRPARLWPLPASILDAAMRLTGRGDLADKLLGSLQVDTSHVARALGYTPQRSADEELRRMVAELSNAPTRKVWTAAQRVL